MASRAACLERCRRSMAGLGVAMGKMGPVSAGYTVMAAAEASGVPAPRIVHIISGLSQGGAESILVRLVGSTRSKWHTSVISLVEKGDNGTVLESLGVTVLCCEMRSRGVLRGLRRLYALLGELRPDVVQTWMYHADLFGGVIARLRGCDAVLWG